MQKVMVEFTDLLEQFLEKKKNLQDHEALMRSDEYSGDEAAGFEKLTILKDELLKIKRELNKFYGRQ